MTPSVDPVAWKEIAAVAIAAAATVGGVVWGMLTGRVTKLEQSALPRVEFETARQESRDDRDEMRRDMRDLFAKNEALRELIDAKMDRMRSDMNGGFESLRAEMRGRNL